MILAAFVFITGLALPDNGFNIIPPACRRATGVTRRVLPNVVVTSRTAKASRGWSCLLSMVGLARHQLFFQSFNAFHNNTAEFPRVSFEDLQAGTGRVSMYMLVITLISPHGLDKRLRVGGPLCGLLYRISRTILCTRHALIHSLSNNRVLCND